MSPGRFRSEGTQGWRSSSLLALVAAGIVAGQFSLFWPSLVGSKVLLPLDILARPNTYLIDGPTTRDIEIHNHAISDIVLTFEFSRRFATQEIRAGRLPTWNPHQFAGTPTSYWPRYSVFSLIDYAFPGPYSLAWIQLAKAVVAGLGAYLFFARVIGVGFWPAAVGAWCYPLTGFFALWVGFPGTATIAFFPWMLFAIARCIRRPAGWGGPAFAALAALVLLAGQLDMSAQVLLGCAIYALWPLFREHRTRLWSGGARAVAVLIVAGVVGLAGASPYVLPLVEYSSGGSRMEARRLGIEERPPVGAEALTEIILPDVYGTMESDSIRIGNGNQMNGSATAYAGLIAALLLAPLALASRQHFWSNATFLGMGTFGLSWLLALPGATALLRLPGINMLSHNRMAFLSAFSILALSVVGLDILLGGGRRLNRWLHALPILVGALAAWFAYRCFVLPEPLATQAGTAIAHGQTIAGVPNVAALELIQHGFRDTYLMGAVLCALVAIAWILLRWRPLVLARPVGGTTACLLLLEMLLFAHGRMPQTDVSLYYPRLPVLEKLRSAPAGRIIGVRCLPARLAESHGLSDIRGYDSVDPTRMIQLLKLAEDRGPSNRPRYARTQFYRPRMLRAFPEPIRLMPILDMLNLRYLVFRGTPPKGSDPFIGGEDYWVAENRNALPRAFIPKNIMLAADDSQRLAKLGSVDFDPRELAYVEFPGARPFPTDSQGSVRIVKDLPAEVHMSVTMQTPGLVVLADRWDAGWQASVDGEPVEVLRVNHAIRGVKVGPGDHTIEMNYEQASLKWALPMCAGALVGLILWCGLVLAGERRRTEIDYSM